MITLKQTLVVTHDDPYVEYYKKYLTKESGWYISGEDTRGICYEHIVYYKTIDGDVKITYPIKDGEND